MVDKEEASRITEETYEEIKNEIEKRKKEAEEEGKRYYTPFAIGQEADEIPVRCEQIDMQEQTMITWLSCPHREHKYFQQHVLEPKNGTFTNVALYFDGGQAPLWDRGRYPIKKDEMTTPTVAYYNCNDRLQKSFYADSPFVWKETLEDSCNNYFILSCGFFDIWGRGYESDRGQHSGFRGHIAAIAGLGGVVKTHPSYDGNIFWLWEEMNWKKADMKKIKANMWLAKNPTLIRAKKAEIKKIKADAWTNRALFPFSLRTIRWGRWKYREIWELKEEIRKLKVGGKGEEKIENIEEPKAVFANRPYCQYHSVYTYPYRLDREKVKMKSVAGYKEDLKKAKEELGKLKEEKKKRLKAAIKKENEWLKWYRREWKKQRNEVDSFPRIIEPRNGYLK